MFSISRKFVSRSALISAALALTLSSFGQFAAAGPVAPPPGKAAATNCYRKAGPVAPPPGKMVGKKKGCYSKLGPVAPPPGR
jgi:hypothetical protein